MEQPDVLDDRTRPQAIMLATGEWLKVLDVYLDDGESIEFTCEQYIQGHPHDFRIRVPLGQIMAYRYTMPD